jgi:hypothetical protein
MAEGGQAMTDVYKLAKAVVEWTDKHNAILGERETGLASWHLACEGTDKQRKKAIEELRQALLDSEEKEDE